MRRSVDIDYHWTGDVASKQRALAELFDRRLLPDVRRRLSFDGSVQAPPSESDVTVVVELTFWRLGSELGRIEIPVAVLRIECLDPPTARTADGIVYLTSSDADMFESKVIAVVSRGFPEHRDLVDLYLFASHAAPDAASRLSLKCSALGIEPDSVARRLDALRAHSSRHSKAVDQVIQEQLDSEAAGALEAAGGGRLVVAAVVTMLERLFRPGAESVS